MDVNYSLESKYGASNTFKFSEHILDINTTYDNGLYINTQFEYSDPPLFGENITGINSGYLDYYSNKIQFTLGNLSTLYGRGISVNTYQDHTIDFDNRINGFELKYFLNDNITLFSVLGNSTFHYRQTPADQKANFSMNFGYLTINGFEYINDKIGNIHMLFMVNQISSLSSNLSYYDFSDYTANNNEINISWNKYFDVIELYFEYSRLDYMMNDIFNHGSDLGKDTTGYRSYGTFNTSIFDIGITYEYKNYLHPGYISPFSSPPIVYRESNSILASRNAHNMNFQDEIGHQIDLNYAVNNQLNINGNLSLAYRNNRSSHQLLYGRLNPTLLESSLTFNEDDLAESGVFRQWYIEANGWCFNEKVFYKVGIDNFNEMDKYGKYIYAITFPSLFTINFNQSHSLNMYIEYQDKSIIESPSAALKIQDNIELQYLSLTYNLFSKVSFSYFHDTQNQWFKYFFDSADNIDGPKTKSDWIGYEFGYKINSTNQLSIFYGSQKGGLVCANGICAQQPDFVDGVKVTLRSLF